MSTEGEAPKEVSGPVVGLREDFQSLRNEYKDAPGFLAGLDQLNRKYSGLRRVLGDGNCFYR
jgi:hypothetical protein